jgi:ATP-dependent Lhr-like helicase
MGQPLSFAYCQAIKTVLQSDVNVERYSRRAVQEINEAQAEFTWLEQTCTSFVMDTEQGRCLWWTFAGSRANAMLAESLRNFAPTGFDNLCIRFDRAVDPEAVQQVLAAAQKHPPSTVPIADLDRAIDELKFAACLPRQLAEQLLAVRLSDPDALGEILEQPLRVVRI